MYEVAVLACVFVLCSAQPPPVPKIPETFYSSVNVELHSAEGTIFGRGNFAQDFNAGHLVENATTDDGTDYLGLALYDKGEDYVYRAPKGATPSCQSRSLSGTIPSYWGWVANATFRGYFPDPYTHRNLSVWYFEPGFGTRFELGVSEQDPNLPVFNNLYRTSGDSKVYFFSFYAVTPAPGNFTVPAACQ
ncbi:hypothetical protein EMCRGX_G025031 [Ephydatia muelleri]|eukprot:Em0015g1193a